MVFPTTAARCHFDYLGVAFQVHSGWRQEAWSSVGGFQEEQRAGDSGSTEKGCVPELVYLLGDVRTPVFGFTHVARTDLSKSLFMRIFAGVESARYATRTLREPTTVRMNRTLIGTDRNLRMAHLELSAASNPAPRPSPPVLGYRTRRRAIIWIHAAP